ncbi:MAG: hypothetical protein COA42_23795 [Alteromonadaceae bacterium]|nr:MAG: hypothetical protein COA42_23795 [Alteromonadaceae bacterium]
MVAKADSKYTNTGIIKNIPYGVSDYGSIQAEQEYYVDKTHFIPALEKSRYAVLIRPRRMGKSLWISLLERYYDITEKHSFEQAFGST